MFVNLDSAEEQYGLIERIKTLSIFVDAHHYKSTPTLLLETNGMFVFRE